MKQFVQSHSIGKLIGGLFVLQLAWFALLHPLIPSNMLGFLIEFTAGICVFFTCYAAGKAVLWLAARQDHRNLFKTLAVAIALSVGPLVFFFIYLFRTTLAANFHYFIFARH